MRRFLTGLVVAATTALVPVLATAGNQEFAEQIANQLRASGQMHDYKIGVMYQDGTAWLRGSVCSDEQAQTAIEVVSRLPGVSRVENKLTVRPSAPAAEPAQAIPTVQSPTARPQAAAFEGVVSPPSSAVSPEQFPRVSGGGMSGGRVVAGGAVSASALRLQEVQSAPQTAAVSEIPASPSASSATATEAQPLATATEDPEPRRQRVPVHNVTPRPMRSVTLAAAQEPAAPAPMPAGSPEQMQTYAQPGSPMPMSGPPMPMSGCCPSGGACPRRDMPNLPCHAWPSYASYPNYAAVTYPRQYSATAWPYIGPFYPYPQVPLGWRKVTLEWDDGWWMLDFKQ